MWAKKRKTEEFLRQVLSNTGIVQSRQIKIPFYSNAYNPSLIPYKNGYLLSFRSVCRWPSTMKHSLRSDISLIGLVRLDKNFKVAERSIQILNLVSHGPHFSLTAEDARLFFAKDRIFIFFNDLPFAGAPGQFAMYFGELIEDQGRFIFKDKAKPLNYFHAIGIEKNWSPFVYQDQLYVIYSDKPRII